MSTTSDNRTQLVQQLNETVQRLGNLNVLFTHCISSHIGLSATEFECLDILGQMGPVPAGRLAERTGLTTGAITGIVDRLERAGFARRQADAHDRRRVIICPVQDPAARAAIIELYRPMSEAFIELTKRYTDAELAVILDFIRHSQTMTERATQELRDRDKA